MRQRRRGAARVSVDGALLPRGERHRLAVVGGQRQVEIEVAERAFEIDRAGAPNW